MVRYIFGLLLLRIMVGFLHLIIQSNVKIEPVMHAYMKKMYIKLELYLWGPNDLWAGPIYPGESKGPSRGGLRPGLDRITFGCSRGQFGPRQTQSSSAERRVEMVSD